MLLLIDINGTVASRLAAHIENDANLRESLVYIIRFIYTFVFIKIGNWHNSLETPCHYSGVLVLADSGRATCNPLSC